MVCHMLTHFKKINTYINKQIKAVATSYLKIRFEILRENMKKKLFFAILLGTNSCASVSAFFI